jgi:hypothetical protein
MEISVLNSNKPKVIQLNLKNGTENKPWKHVYNMEISLKNGSSNMIWKLGMSRGNINLIRVVLTFLETIFQLSLETGINIQLMLDVNPWKYSFNLFHVPY